MAFKGINLLAFIGLTAAGHADHDWTSYDDTAECTSEDNTFVTFIFVTGAGDIIPGVDSRPDNIMDIDTVGDLALVPEMYNDEYWIDGRYNNQNFQVTEGVIVNSVGNTFTAFQINPPTATHSLSFLATEQHIWYKFPDYGDYQILEFDEEEGTFSLYKSITGQEIYDLSSETNHGFTHIEDSDQAALEKTKIYAIMDSESDLANIWLNEIEQNSLYQAKVFDNYERKVTLNRFSMGSDFAFPTPSEEGPSSEENNFGQLKDFHHIVDEDDNMGIFYQDSSNKLIAIFFTDEENYYQVEFENQDDQKLLSVTNGQEGELYYILGDTESAGDSESELGIKLYRSKLSGSLIRVVDIKTSDASDGIDVYEVSTSCQLIYSEDDYAVALYMSRIVTDGDETQSNIIAFYDKDHLRLNKIVDSSLQSQDTVAFGMKLLQNDDMEGFVGVSLGDYSTRSIKAMTFKQYNDADAPVASQEIYHMKAKHGEEKYRELELEECVAGGDCDYEDYDNESPVPQYLDADGEEVVNYLDDDTDYRAWSNDMQYYTELATPGIEETEEGHYIVFWTGEKDIKNNTAVGEYLNLVRNIGFTLLDTDLNIVTSDAESSDGLAYEGTVEEEFGTEFYDVEGTKATSVNGGFAWITDYAADLEDNSLFSYTIDDLPRDEKQADKLKPWKNASRLKHVKIADELIFLIYEIWDDSEFQYTAYMIVDEFGNVDTEETKICYPIRLHRSDAIRTVDDGETVVIVEGQEDGYLNVYRIEASSKPSRSFEGGNMLILNSLALVALLVSLVL